MSALHESTRMSISMNLSAIILPEDVILDLPVSSKAELIKRLSAHAAARLGLDERIIRAALTSREELGSTGIGRGVAIPHAAVESLGSPFAILAVLRKAVDFESVDEIPVNVVFLLLTPPSRPGEHLTILSAVARKTSADQVLKVLRMARSPAAAYAVLVDETS